MEKQKNAYSRLDIGHPRVDHCAHRHDMNSFIDQLLNQSLILGAQVFWFDDIHLVQNTHNGLVCKQRTNAIEQFHLPHKNKNHTTTTANILDLGWNDRNVQKYP